jgi:hypothetical protein
MQLIRESVIMLLGTLAFQAQVLDIILQFMSVLIEHIQSEVAA